MQPSEATHSNTPQETKTVLVTGATGYIGGRLVPRLLEAGHRVKVLVRTPQKIADVPWHDQVEIIEDSLSDAGSLTEALEGVDVLYYLVHSMASGSGFEAKEESMARLVAACRGGCGRGQDRLPGRPAPGEPGAFHRICGPARPWAGCSLSLPVDSIVFQAGVVIGSGSASFEMIRHLAETLPVMPAPSWVNNRVEAIAVRDVLHYLVAAAALPEKLNRSFDIGSRDVLKYKDMMNEYAVERGLPRRLVIALPVPAPKLAGLWVALVTPIPLSMSLPLVQSLQHDAVSREHDVDRYIPQPDGGLTPYRRAVALALGKERDVQVETTWANAGIDADPLPSDPDWAGYKVFLDERTFHSEAKPEHVWTIIEGIGGKNGWYSLPLGVAGPGLAGQVAGRRRALAGTQAPQDPEHRRGSGLVAGGGDRPRAPAAFTRRDAGPRRRLA